MQSIIIIIKNFFNLYITSQYDNDYHNTIRLIQLFLYFRLFNILCIIYLNLDRKMFKQVEVFNWIILVFDRINCPCGFGVICFSFAILRKDNDYILAQLDSDCTRL